MAHECEKEREFGEITTTLRFFQEAEKRREAREEDMLETMKQIAGQSEIIKAHTETLGDIKKSLINLFERIQVLETSGSKTDPDKNVFVQIANSTSGPYILIVLVAVFFIVMIANPDLAVRIITHLVG